MKIRTQLWFNPAALAELRRRAKAHRLSMSKYAEAVLTGHWPGGAPGQPAADADSWWGSLPPERRAQIHGWVARNRDTTDPGPEQLTIFDGGTT